MPPDMNDGFSTCTFCAPNIGAHRLDQHQADAPGGEQRLERPAVEPADHRALEEHADRAGDQEGGRNGGEQVPVEEAGPAEKILHDIGRVRADHDQLAVRHVDHAHQAVSDGEAERGEQQDRAERGAGEREAEPLAPGEARLDRAQALLRLEADLFVGVAGRFEQQRLVGWRAQGADRGQARRPVVALELHARRGHLEQGLDVGVGSFSFAFRTSGSMAGRRRRRGPWRPRAARFVSL
jgi:hypothetical protein